MTAAEDAAAVASLLPMDHPIAQLARMSLDRLVREESEARMTIINAPAAGFTGRSTFGPVDLDFRDGVAELDGELSDGLRQYLVANGYGIDDTDPVPHEPPPLLTTLDGGPAPDARDLGPVEMNPFPEPADPAVIVGTPLRDAAVDPRPGDFVSPINAGQHDPHGAEVVAIEVGSLEWAKRVAEQRGATPEQARKIAGERVE